MDVRYAAALPLMRAPSRGAATVQQVAEVQTRQVQNAFRPPVPVSTQFLPPSEVKSVPAATALAASAYKAAKGAVSVD